MSMTKFNTEKMNEPLFSFFDRAGTWGPGCDIEADVEIMNYEFPSAKDPGYDKEEDSTAAKPYRGPYVLFALRCSRDGEKDINQDWFVEQNRALVTLVALGVHVGEDGAHDTDQVNGLKCIITTGDPGNNQEGKPAYSRIRSLQGIG